MRKILIIDKGDSSIHHFKKTLANKGYSLISEKNIKKAIPCLKNSGFDLIVIDNTFSLEVGSSTRFRKLTSNTPKIVLTRQHNLNKGNLWLKDRFAFPICEPFTFREFKYLAEKLLKNKSIEDENKLLQTDLKTRKKELRFFDHITRNLTATSNLNKSLTSLMEKVKIMTGAKACSLLLIDEPFLEMIPLQRSKKIQKFRFKKGVGIAGCVLEKGIPLNIQDVMKDSRFDKKIDNFSNLKVKSLMCAPLKIKDRVVGVLRLINKNHKNPFTTLEREFLPLDGVKKQIARRGWKPYSGFQTGFTDNDMNLLRNAASYAATVIERAFLYEKLKNDELTNLFNMRYLNQAIEMEIERARRYNAIFSIVFMDIDNFKKVNERFGHLIGSRVLVEIAQLLQENLRKIDIISRYGGDEFVIILPQTQREVSFLVAERLRKVIEKNVFLKQEGFSIRLTASFGVASFPDNARNKEELIKIADKAMYRGKFSTKNIVFAAK